MPRKKYLSDADAAILRGMSVLYVEDESTTREIFSDMLARIVGRVHAAEDGEAGLAAFREYAPDMVISDIQMPCMNGLDMAAAIKRLAPRTPIIITTAFNDNDLLLKAISAGIDKFLLKPVDKHALDEALIQCARPLDTEKRLRESEARYRIMLEQAADGVFLADQKGRYLDVNPSGCRMLGFTREEMLQFSIHDLVLPSWHDKVEPHLEEMQQVRQMVLETHLRCKDGGYLAVEVSSCVLGNGLLMATVRDISQRKRMEQALRESEQQFRHITENIGDLVALLDTQGRRLYNSPSYKAIFGEVPPPGSNSFDDVHPEDRERICALFAETVRSGQGRRTQYRLLLKSGAVRYVESSAGVVRDEQGAVSHVVMVAHDVTERHEMEKTILEIDEKVRMAIGLELHDDLGQQLTGIGFIAKTLESRLAAQSLPESRDAARIVQGVTNAINQTRALSKGLYPVELEENGLPPALDQLAAYVRDTFGVACSFSCSCAVSLPGGVAIHLYRIAQEAVSNAVRHGNASRIGISLSSSSDGVSLRIANNGAHLEMAGMPDSSGMGLRIMKYRAGLIGAQLEFYGAPHGETIVGVVFSNPVC